MSAHITYKKVDVSCIICTRSQELVNELKRNLDETIGCDYEFITIDNSESSYNIFSAYKEGVRRANGEFLCFIHEDVYMHSMNWGPKVIKHFDNPLIGLIGVAGTHFVSGKTASPWWASAMESGQLIQGSFVNGNYQCYHKQLFARRKTDSIEAVIVDGFWFCVRKSLFDDSLINFDDVSFSGFHCYDADICMQVINARQEVRIVYDILVEHKSLGRLGFDYFKQLDVWYCKWKHCLPLFRGVEMSDVEVYEREIICKEYTNLFRDVVLLSNCLERTKSSVAYKLGSYILRPFRFIRSEINILYCFFHG